MINENMKVKKNRDVKYYQTNSHRVMIRKRGSSFYIRIYSYDDKNKNEKDFRYFELEVKKT